MRGIKNLLAVISGRAVVITQTADKKADVTVGKSLTTQFAVSSMLGAVKLLTL